MLAKTFTDVIDLMHAKLCYQMFITPLNIPIEKKYRIYATRALEFFASSRSEFLSFDTPRHHVIHRFNQPDNPQAKKVLITHGWMSRAAYMAHIVNALHREGYDVYALDFPAHGEAKGRQLPWTDAVIILRQLLNDIGPFYGVVGHSFGGSMLLNSLTLAYQFPEWEIRTEPERVIMMGSPTRMRVPVSKFAREFKLSGKGYLHLRELFRQHSTIDIRQLDFRHFTSKAQLPFLCIHGKEDRHIVPSESSIFCQHYPYASLAILPEADHVSVLMDKRAERKICEFLKS